MTSPIVSQSDSVRETVQLQEIAASEVSTCAEQHLESVTADVDALLGSLSSILDYDLLSPAAGTFYDAGMVLYGSTNDSQKHLGQVMALDALIASGDAVAAALRTLRTQLVASDPALALVK